METRNIIAAISLSAAVIILYTLFFAPPPVNKENLVESHKWHTTKKDLSKQYRDEDHVIKFKFQQQA